MTDLLTYWRGHVCVAKNQGDDYSLRLGMEDWKDFFDVCEVDFETWNELREIGFWQDINDACGVLIDLYEEEWLWPSQFSDLVEVIEKYRETFSRVASEKNADKLKNLLDRFLMLCHSAMTRAVPIIFAF